MAESLGLKRRSLCHIESGKTKKLSKAVGTLLEQIYMINLAYMYNNSDQMFLKSSAAANSSSAVLSEFSNDQIVKYVIDNQESFMSNILFRSYLDVVTSGQKAKAAAETYAKVKRLGAR